MANVNVTISPASNAKKATYISDANILKLSNISQKYFFIKMTGENVRIFSFLFSYAKNTTHIEKTVKLKRVNRAFKTLQTAKLLNPGLILKWTHVAHARPCCWTLVWSWNELALLMLLNPGLILKWTHVAHVRPRCWTLAWSWNELSSGSLFRLWTATLLENSLILKWTQLR